MATWFSHNVLFHQLYLYQALYQDVKLGSESRATTIPKKEPKIYSTKYTYHVGEDRHSYKENIKCLEIEAKKGNPDEFKIYSLMKRTFLTRRQKITMKKKHVRQIVEKFPSLRSSFGVSL